ncbi:MAG: hypothetical protein GY797_20780 [Deltaproteobacteria bacterium]|nr:hypothetical protein [Deltaproteobacteria bacterium]
MNRLKLIYISSIVMFLISGCASTFMAGSQPHKGIPSNTIAVYKVPKCINQNDSSTIDGPKGITYYLVETESGPILYELDQKGSGAAITNYWKDENGMNFLTYVKTSHGWQYVIADDKTKPAVRKCYVRGTFRVMDVNGVLKVTSGNPTYNCEMIPQ